MSTTLVVYYSRGGTTRRLARQLARALNADLDEITTPTGRAGRLGYVRCVVEALTHFRPSILAHQDPAKYSGVLVGTPVWANTMASPVRSYLATRTQKFKQIAFFCTMGGGGDARTFQAMTALSGTHDPLSFSATQDEVDNDLHSAALEVFVRSVQNAWR